MWMMSLHLQINKNLIILYISIKLPFIFKTFVLSIYELHLKTGFTVIHVPHCCRFARLHETYSEIDVEAVNLNGK